MVPNGNPLRVDPVSLVSACGGENGVTGLSHVDRPTASVVEMPRIWAWSNVGIASEDDWGSRWLAKRLLRDDISRWYVRSVRHRAMRWPREPEAEGPCPHDKQTPSLLRNAVVGSTEYTPRCPIAKTLKFVDEIVQIPNPALHGQTGNVLHEHYSRMENPDGIEEGGQHISRVLAAAPETSRGEWLTWRSAVDDAGGSLVWRQIDISDVRTEMLRLRGVHLVCVECIAGLVDGYDGVNPCSFEAESQPTCS